MAILIAVSVRICSHVGRSGSRKLAGRQDQGRARVYPQGLIVP